MNALASNDRRRDFAHRFDQAEANAHFFHAGDEQPSADYDDELREGAAMKGYTGSLRAADLKARSCTAAGSA